MASKCADYKLEQRAYVKIRTLLKMSAKEIHNDLFKFSLMILFRIPQSLTGLDVSVKEPTQ